MNATIDATPVSAAAPRPLPEPWGMSIRDLDRWHAHYDALVRLCPMPLTDAEVAHRAEVARNIALRDEARRFTIARR